MSDYKHWLLKIEDRIARLTLNRPEKMNAITPDTLSELRDISRNIKETSAIWAVVLEGAGEHFSVGVDVNAIGELIGQEHEAFRHHLYNMQLCLDEFEALPKPTIAKIRGYCVGGGVLLSLCCDFRLAAAGATFMVPEVKRGIAVIMGTQRLTRIIGLARTKELTMLGDPITAEQAHQYGMLTQVVPNDQLDAATSAFAAKFHHLPPLTVSVCKYIADQGQGLSLRQSQDLEIQRQSELLGTEDFQEAISSFFEKRPPLFTGR